MNENGNVTSFKISIHALREEGDFLLRKLLNLLMLIFLSTPSARRATYDESETSGGIRISIHALREEGDVYDCMDDIREYFISIHALREEGDNKI